MTRGKRGCAPHLEVRLLREGIVESTHRVEAVVCDNRGRVLLGAGNSETVAFARSALKPFQALAVTSTGTLEKYNLTDKDLAIICSSHQGKIEQTRQVFNILWRCDLHPSSLQCPIPPDKTSPLEHNCSGKHAGMLAVCQHFNWSINDYLERHHQVQKLILTKMAEILKMPAEEFIVAHDDCGAPTYLMQLDQMASLYARLASGDRLDLERIIRAMTHYPELISGPGMFDTQLMELTEGQIVAKSGSEGVECIGRIGEGMGLAIKVTDGARRAKYAVAIHLLKQLGWITPTIAETLTEKFMNSGPYKRLEVIGELC
ncbi:asparaginase [Merismopedia glauca]|uniref:Asparaginase n=1 Tax=Merismopedia glauca CCAP 1448/3 TaxID=1296344 RepID=A0A2T1BZX7_9CYAN|nr:asparaginase [Merismopedia glauca]PSB01576.1 asparaginase [Merismopedia glauca CCAP 1448/3]